MEERDRRDHLKYEFDLFWKQMEEAMFGEKLLDLIICSGGCQDDQGNDNPEADYSLAHIQTEAKISFNPVLLSSNMQGCFLNRLRLTAAIAVRFFCPSNSHKCWNWRQLSAIDGLLFIASYLTTVDTLRSYSPMMQGF